MKKDEVNRMAMICVDHCKECNGCMRCQDDEPPLQTRKRSRQRGTVKERKLKITYLIINNKLEVVKMRAPKSAIVYPGNRIYMPLDTDSHSDMLEASK